MNFQEDYHENNYYIRKPLFLVENNFKIYHERMKTLVVRHFWLNRKIARFLDEL